jgi:hypothetical protein
VVCMATSWVRPLSPLVVSAAALFQWIVCIACWRGWDFAF